MLDQLDDLVAARDAHVRWPNWMFMRKLNDWQAKQTDGSELRAREPRPLSRR